MPTRVARLSAASEAAPVGEGRIDTLASSTSSQRQITVSGVAMRRLGGAEP